MASRSAAGAPGDDLPRAHSAGNERITGAQATGVPETLEVCVAHEGSIRNTPLRFARLLWWALFDGRMDEDLPGRISRRQALRIAYQLGGWHTRIGFRNEPCGCAFWFGRQEFWCMEHHRESQAKRRQP